MQNKNAFQQDLLSYRRNNFKTLGPYAFCIYMVLFWVDYNLVKTNIWTFFWLRLIFILPMITLSQLSGKMNKKTIDLAIMVSFISTSLGLSLISYHLGGIVSDYYFGLLIISFVQYAFTPLPLRKTIILDALNGIIFFSINLYQFDFPQEEIVKQVSNFLSFVLLKYIVVNRSNTLLSDSLKKAAIEEELRGKKILQKVFGELCHLFNNPLFISISVLKKTQKKIEDPEISHCLDKALLANQRMEIVLRKMLELQESQEIHPQELMNFSFDKESFNSSVMAEDSNKSV